MLDDYRRGDREVPELSLAQIREQMPLAVSRVMSEGSLYDPQLAALALKQAAGDAIEAVFLLRAYRTTLSRFGYTQPLDTGRMRLQRRISSTFKDVPGGQILGPTYDYTSACWIFRWKPGARPMPCRRARNAGLVHAARHRPAGARRPDRSRAAAGRRSRPLRPDAPAAGFSADRAARLQNLARADEGFLLSMGYSTQRGYGNTHPFAAEIRYGALEVEMHIEELGFAVTVGEIEVTECQMVSQFSGNAQEGPKFTRGYGLTFGYGERKAMSMALVDRALKARDLGKPVIRPPMTTSSCSITATTSRLRSFVQHLKLPHYVDFQANLELLRRMRGERLAAAAAPNDLMDEAVTP